MDKYIYSKYHRGESKKRVSSSDEEFCEVLPVFASLEGKCG